MANRAAALERLLAMSEDESREAGHPEMGRALREWLEGLAAEYPNVSTRIGMVGRVRRCVKYTGYVVDAPGLQRFFAWLGEEGGRGGEPVSKEEKKAIQQTLRRFWRYLHPNSAEDRDLPPILRARLKGPTRTLQPEDLLTQEEVEAIIAAASDIRDKAIIAVLWDSGCRIDELASLRAEDVSLHPGYRAFNVRFRVPDSESKRHSRTNLLFECFPYLRDYLNTYRLEGRGPLWLQKKNGTRAAMATDGLRVTVMRAVEATKSAGTLPKHKHVYCHLFRHSRATLLLKGRMPESSLKRRLGWTLSSKMLARYVHLSDTDVAEEDEAIFHNVKPIETGKKPHTLAFVVCPQCEAPNAPTNKFCSVCGSETDPKEREARIAVRTRILRDILESDTTSRDIKEMLIKLIASGQADRIQMFEMGVPADEDNGEESPKRG